MHRLAFNLLLNGDGCVCRVKPYETTNIKEFINQVIPRAHTKLGVSIMQNKEIYLDTWGIM